MQPATMLTEAVEILRHVGDLINAHKIECKLTVVNDRLRISSKY